MLKKFFYFTLAIAFATPIIADDQGSIWFENRVFNSDGNSKTRDYNSAISTRLQGKSPETVLGQLTYRFFGRADAQDNTRSLAFIEELYWGVGNDMFDIKVGWQLFNWSSTEAFHPSDIINSRNVDSDFDSLEKKGEPTIGLSFFPIEELGITFLYFPTYVAPNLPHGNNRLTIFNPDYPLGKALWLEGTDEFSADELGDQFGLVIDLSLGGDWKFFFLDHMDRHNPIFVVSPITFEIRPVYLPVQRYGLTFQTDWEAHLWKLEYAQNRFRKNNGTYLFTSMERANHGALALGWEIGFSHDSGLDSTFIVEYQRYTGVDKQTRQGLSYFQNDVLLGYRLAFNDTMSNELFFSFIYDIEKTGGTEMIYTGKYSRRLTDVWSMSMDLRVVNAAPVNSSAPTGLEFFDEDQQINFKLKRFF
jgi:hypothetical protein